MASLAYLPALELAARIKAREITSVVSAPYRDYRTIAFADLVAQEIGGFVAPPDFD